MMGKKAAGGMKNKKIPGRKAHDETGRRGCRGMRRRNESNADSTSEVGRCSKKPRTLTRRSGGPFPRPETVALISRRENAPPPMNFPDHTQPCLPQAKLTAKSSVDSVDFPSMKAGIVKDSISMDFLIGFVDEEEMFNMPGLVNGMAEGMLLTPPAMKRGFNWSHDIHDHHLVDDANFYINLWDE
ncbi:uncharacterized protein [Henckelia pumila]|uniref:uncharacterized protein n=1 Tax=Henckelia pumila TaxID=405737 RepID=UPI003C6E7470